MSSDLEIDQTDLIGCMLGSSFINVSTLKLKINFLPENPEMRMQ